jgi:acetyl esterase/lipase
LIITAGNDSLADETERLNNTMVKAGVNVTYKRFEGAVHGFTQMNEKRGKKMPDMYKSALEAQKMILDFIEKYL